jgi:hypothetical protein
MSLPAWGRVRPLFFNLLHPYICKLGTKIFRYYLVLQLNVQCIGDLDKHVRILLVDWYNLVIHIKLVFVTSNWLLLSNLFACSVHELASNNVPVHVLALVPWYLPPILLNDILYVGHTIHALVLYKYVPGFPRLLPWLFFLRNAIQLRLLPN